MFAVISHNGNQYKVETGKEYKIALLPESEEKNITFNEVLIFGDEKETKVGTPNVSGASVEAEIVGLTRGEKLTTKKFKPKKRYQRNLGHRQDYTVVKITSIKA